MLHILLENAPQVLNSEFFHSLIAVCQPRVENSIGRTIVVARVLDLDIAVNDFAITFSFERIPLRMV